MALPESTSEKFARLLLPENLRPSVISLIILPLVEGACRLIHDPSMPPHGATIGKRLTDGHELRENLDAIHAD